MQRKNFFPYPNDRWIGVVAASTLIDKKLLLNGLKLFSQWGYVSIYHESIFQKFRSMAGSDEIRAKNIEALVKNKNVGTLWFARGGYGATRLLSILEQKKVASFLKKDPKLLIGFSDVTALHLYFYQKLGLPSLHAPMPATKRWATLSTKTKGLLRSFIDGSFDPKKNPYTESWNTKLVKPIKSDREGILLGGNLSLIASLVGTPYLPNFKNAILFLEDCGEAPYRVDRMLTQLSSAGILKNLQGVVLGDFEADVMYTNPKIEKSYWKPTLRERFLDYNIPVLENVPVGHGKYNEPLPLGIRVSIQKNGTLKILEPITRSLR